MSSVILQDITTDIRHPDSLIIAKMFTVSIVFTKDQSDVHFTFVILLARASKGFQNNRLKVLYSCNYGSFIQNLSKGTLETLSHHDVFSCQCFLGERKSQLLQQPLDLPHSHCHHFVIVSIC